MRQLFWIGLILVGGFAFSLQAQEVRRALPVDASTSASDLPAPKAIPFAESLPKLTTPAPRTPSPTPTSTPSPTPTLGVPESITTLPTPAPLSANSKSPDVILLDYANSFYSRKLYETAAPEYEKYLSTYLGGPERQAAEFRLGECYRALRDINSTGGVV